MSPGQWLTPYGARANADAQLRHTVHITGPTTGLTVGPDEVLVLAYAHPMDTRAMEAIRDRLLDSRLRPDQILIIAGQGAQVVRVQPRPLSWLARTCRRLVSRRSR